MFNARKFALICCMAFGLAIAGVSVHADEDPFPGQGSIADWRKANAEYKIAHEFKSKEQWGNAIDHFRYAISVYPYDSRYFASRASCFRKIGEPRTALTDIGKALKLKNLAVYWMMAADTYAEDMGEFMLCRKAVNTAASLNDSSIAVLMNAMLPKYRHMCERGHLAWPDTAEKLTLADLGVDTSPQYVPDRWKNLVKPPAGAQGVRPGLRWGNSNDKNFGIPTSTGTSSALPTDLSDITDPKPSHKFPSPWGPAFPDGNKRKN